MPNGPGREEELPTHVLPLIMLAAVPGLPHAQTTLAERKEYTNAVSALAGERWPAHGRWGQRRCMFGPWVMSGQG